MFEDLKNQKIVVDITNLIINPDKEEDAYCEFMKGIILNTSGLN